MQITADYINPTLVKADTVGRNDFRDEQELKSIYKQLVELVSRGNYKLRKIYDQPLDDNVLLPICKDEHVIVKERIRIYALEGITVYEYIFIYKGVKVLNEFVKRLLNNLLSKNDFSSIGTYTKYTPEVIKKDSLSTK